MNSIQDALKKTEEQGKRLVVCSVYDSKAREFVQPVLSRTIEESIRSFGAAARKEGHDFREFATDYTLWHLADFNPTTGVYENVDKRQICSATDFAPQVKPA